MSEPARDALGPFHGLPHADAIDALLACCASPAWAAAIAAGRPYPDLATLLRAADVVFAALDWTEVDLALAAHPRMDGAAAWSRRESTSAAGDPALLAELARATADYERAFGRVFLLDAGGHSAAEILANLRERLGNDEWTERATVRAELRGIVLLRLTRWLA